MKNPRTANLKRIAGTSEGFRLLPADRVFLHDLARLNILSDDLAARNHYAHLKGGATRSLNRLEAAGLIVGKKLHIPGQVTIRIYQFRNQAVARAWGGALPVIGAKRNELHELISSRMYFELGEPDDFRLAADFSKSDVSAFGSCRPDALYTDSATGELVAVEADSGHYSKKQIVDKLSRWQAVGIGRIAWGQPSRAMDRVPQLENLKLLKF